MKNIPLLNVQLSYLYIWDSLDELPHLLVPGSLKGADEASLAAVDQVFQPPHLPGLGILLYLQDIST